MRTQTLPSLFIPNCLSSRQEKSMVKRRTRIEGYHRAFCTTELFIPFSGAGKHPDFQVTSCLRFVSTDVDFAYIKSE